MELLRALGNFEPPGEFRILSCMAAVGIYCMTSPHDRLLDYKARAVEEQIPDLVLLKALFTMSGEPADRWVSQRLPQVVLNHGLPRPVGLAGRGAELLGCAAAATVLGLGTLSVDGKQRLAAWFREAVSPRALRRAAILAVHRVALALCYRGLLRSFGVPIRIRTSAPEAVFECVVATLTGHFLPTDTFSSLPPYLTMWSVVSFNWPAYVDGMIWGQNPDIFDLADDYAYPLVGDALMTAFFGCHALRAPRVSWQHAAILFANTVASLGASWSAASLEKALETAGVVPKGDEA